MAIQSWTWREGLPRRMFAPATKGVRRGLLLAAIAGSALWAAHATDGTGTADALSWAGADLTRLLRGMALIKATMAAGVVAVVWWRFALPTTAGWLLAYTSCGAAMAAGPVLIWDMAHVGLGALLLHGGLFAAMVALWRDPAVAAELGSMIAVRQRALANRVGRIVEPSAEAAPAKLRPPHLTPFRVDR